MYSFRLPGKTKKMHCVKINAELNLVKFDISSLSQTIISLIKDHGKLSIGEIVTLTQANRNTIKANLKVLTAKVTFKSLETGRAVLYYLEIYLC